MGADVKEQASIRKPFVLWLRVGVPFSSLTRKAHWLSWSNSSIGTRTRRFLLTSSNRLIRTWVEHSQRKSSLLMVMVSRTWTLFFEFISCIVNNRQDMFRAWTSSQVSCAFTAPLRSLSASLWSLWRGCRETTSLDSSVYMRDRSYSINHLRRPSQRSIFLYLRWGWCHPCSLLSWSWACSEPLYHLMSLFLSTRALSRRDGLSSTR